MEEDEYIFPASENIEKKSDKKTWFWTECLEDSKKSGCKMGTTEFWLVYKIRVYETHGDYKFCVAGISRLAEDIGATPKQVEAALMNACQTKKLFHIWSDKKVYRNKTKIYVTRQWLEEKGLNPQFLTIMARGKRNSHYVTGTVLENGEVVNVKAECLDAETKCENVETKCQNVVSKCENVVSPRMNKYKRISKRISKNIYAISDEMGQDFGKGNIKNIAKENSPLQTENKRPKRKVPPKEKGNEKELWEQEFDELWQLYPRKESKADGLKFYLKARKKGVTKEQILVGIQRYKQKIEREHTERQFIIKGGNWFKGERWDDEIEIEEATKTATHLDFS